MAKKAKEAGSVVTGDGGRVTGDGKGLPAVRVVEPRMVRCPYCKGGRTYVTSSPKPRRYHKCRGCGKRFVTIEKSG